MSELRPTWPPPRRVVVRCEPHAAVPSEFRRIVPEDVLSKLEKQARACGADERHERALGSLVADLRSAHGTPIPDGADPLSFSQAIGKWESAREVWMEPHPALPPLGPQHARGRRVAAKHRARRTRGATGAKVSFVDVEWGWADHEALPAVRRVFGVSHGWYWHGNAVLGVIVGRNSRAPGIAPRARAMVASPWTAEGGYEVATALAVAYGHLRPGDVLLIELQTACGNATGLPVEVDPVVADVIALARRAGILTIEAAGNGGWHLDEVCVAGRGPVVGASGALLVGAGRRNGTERQPESCWGTAVDCWAWGEEVETAWSNHIGTARDAYNPSFSGTSAAAAIVAGIALAVQSAARSRGRTILPDEMRTRLVSNGQAIPGIGVMPDLAAILEELRSESLAASR